MNYENYNLAKIDASECKTVKYTGLTPPDVELGNIVKIELPERKTKEGATFYVIRFEVRFIDGKKYYKQYSVDFFRKYAKQLGIKAQDVMGALVIAKRTSEFKRISFFSFVGETVDTTTGEATFEVLPYINEEEDLTSVFDKLGI